MKCVFETIGEENGREVRRCVACGREVKLPPSMAGKTITAACGAMPVVVVPLGVGYHLSVTLKWLGFHDDGTCGCRDFAAELDRLGPAGCRKDFRRLAKKLARKAHTRGVPFSRWAAGLALWRAIRQAEKPTVSASLGAKQ
jgi:hypothetical protein